MVGATNESGDAGKYLKWNGPEKPECGGLGFSFNDSTFDAPSLLQTHTRAPSSRPLPPPPPPSNHACARVCTLVVHTVSCSRRTRAPCCCPLPLTRRHATARACTLAVHTLSCAAHDAHARLAALSLPRRHAHAPCSRTPSLFHDAHARCAAPSPSRQAARYSTRMHPCRACPPLLTTHTRALLLLPLFFFSLPLTRRHAAAHEPTRPVIEGTTRGDVQP